MPDVTVTLRWTGAGLVFEGGAEGPPSLRIDGDGGVAPSPVQTLLIALCGCTAADVVEILGKMRVPLQGLEVRVEGDRRADPPRRFTRLRIVYAARGVAAADQDKLRRAVALSHEKYCSVLHTLRPDLEIGTETLSG